MNSSVAVTSKSSIISDQSPADGFLTIRDEPHHPKLLKLQFPEATFHHTSPPPSPESIEPPLQLAISSEKVTFITERLLPNDIQLQYRDFHLALAKNNNNAYTNTVGELSTTTTISSKPKPPTPISSPKKSKLKHPKDLHQPEILFCTRSSTKREPSIERHIRRILITKDKNKTRIKNQLHVSQ